MELHIILISISPHFGWVFSLGLCSFLQKQEIYQTDKVFSLHALVIYSLLTMATTLDLCCLIMWLKDQQVKRRRIDWHLQIPALYDLNLGNFTRRTVLTFHRETYFPCLNLLTGERCDLRHLSIIAWGEICQLHRCIAFNYTTANPGIGQWPLFSPFTSSVSPSSGTHYADQHLDCPQLDAYCYKSLTLMESHFSQTACVCDKKRLLPNSKAVGLR